MSRLPPLLLLLLASRAASAGPIVTVEVEPPSLVLGAAATVTFTVTTSAGRKGRFEPPEWRGLQVLGRSSQSRTTIVNRQVSQAFLYMFDVRPQRKGVLVIGPARYTDSTGNGRSRPYNLRVGDTKAPPPDGGGDGAPALGRVDLAVVAQAEPAEAVPGQQILLTYTLYTRIRINEYAMDEPADRRDEPHSTVGDRGRVLAREHALVVEAAARGRVEPVSGPSGAYGRAAARPPGRCGVSPTSYWGGPASRWAYAAQSSSSSSGGGLAGVTWRGSVGSPIEARMARITSGSWISAISSNRPPQSHRRTSNPKAR